MTSATYRESKRAELVDAEIDRDLSGDRHIRQIWRRVAAVDRTFEKVSFKFTIFDNCYLRKCKFVECDFTGAFFADCTLPGSVFAGCKFDYCRFSRTLVGHDVLEENLPGHENVQLLLARSMRANYAQVGDWSGVNKAMVAELRATKVHLQKAVASHESYYRLRYAGAKRLVMAVRLTSFYLLDMLWGNGESLIKVGRTVLLCVALVGVALWSCGFLANDAIAAAFPVFLGTSASPLNPPRWLAATAAGVRLVVVGLFLSVLIRRFARR